MRSLELLDTVGKYQEVGFEKLYQWTAKQCTDVDEEPSAQLHRAIAILRDRAEFYKYELLHRYRWYLWLSSIAGCVVS